MKTEINILDLFSGIGGFSQGLKQAGFKIKKHYFAEVDKHAQAIYNHQFPESEAVGDVRHVRGSELGEINAITFGSPCQDFSLAGKRRGMDGERSSLITEAIRLIDECRPDFFIWENVKGTFSSNNGEDFAAIIQAFTNLGGYRLEWQLLNTAWFLPQNRERIYLVGRIAGKCAGQVFPIRENDQLALSTLRKKRSKNRLAKCLTVASAKQNLDTNYVKVGAIRGRNPKNPKSRVSGLPTQQMFEENSKDIANTLTSVQKDTVVSYAMGGSKKGRSCINSQRVPEIGDHQHSIRRLTEIECERLQGFEDTWTKYGIYNGEVKEISASQRYKCLGNAVTVDVVQAVGEAIRSTS